MLNRITNRYTKRKQNDLRNSEERRPEDDIADGPTVLERTEDQDEL